MRAVLVILVFAVLGDVTGLAQAQEGEVRFERWYRVERDGAPIGWMSTIERTSGGAIVTETTYEETTLVFGERRTRSVAGMVREDSGGKVLSTELCRTEGEGAPAIFITGLDAQTQTNEQHRAGLGPGAAATFIAKRLESGTNTISVLRVDPLLSGGARRLTLSEIAPCEREIGKRLIEGYCASWGNDAQIMLDARGYPILVEFMDGGKAVVFRAVSRDEALAAYEPTERVSNELVPYSVQAISQENGENIHPASRERFVIERLDGEGWDFTGWIGDHSVSGGGSRLSLRPFPGSGPAPTPEQREAALASTTIINHEAMPRLATPEAAGKSVITRARELERYTRDRIIRKGYRLGLANARSAFMLREGDCTEHAVLLAALLRRERIPAFVVGGLTTAGADIEDGMTQHLWVMVYDSRQGWITLDATGRREVLLPMGATGVTDATVEDLVERLGRLSGELRVVQVTPE